MTVRRDRTDWMKGKEVRAGSRGQARPWLGRLAARTRKCRANPTSWSHFTTKGGGNEKGGWKNGKESVVIHCSFASFRNGMGAGKKPDGCRDNVGSTKEPDGTRTDRGHGDEDGEGGIPGPGVDERRHSERYTGEGYHGPGPGGQHPARRLRYAGQGAYGHPFEHQPEGHAGPAATLVLLDGMPLNSAYTGNVQFGGLAPEDIRQIEVIRGPFSSLYGGYAMGGVVNILTKMPEKEEVTMKGAYGSNDYWRTYTSVRQ